MSFEYIKLDSNEQIIPGTDFVSEKPIDLSQTKSIDGRPLTRLVIRNMDVKFDPATEMLVENSVTINPQDITIDYVAVPIPPPEPEQAIQQAGLDTAKLLLETIKALLNKDDSALKVIYEEINQLLTGAK